MIKNFIGNGWLKFTVKVIERMHLVCFVHFSS